MKFLIQLGFYSIYFLFVVIVFASCKDVPIDRDGSALGAGWWLIPVIFGIILPAWLIYQGYDLAKKGLKWRTQNPDGTWQNHHDPTPQPWYKHKLSWGGILVFLIIWIITIARISTWP